MIGFLGLLVIIGGCVGGAVYASRKDKKDNIKKEQKWLGDYKKSTRMKQDEKFPSGKNSVSDILLYMMSSEENGIPQEWMKDVKRLEGDAILSEEIYGLFWEKYNELLKQYHKFDTEVDRYEEMKELSNSGFKLYLDSMYELKAEIYELAEACYFIMRKNEEIVEQDYHENVEKIGEEKDVELESNAVEKETSLTLEQEKLWAIYRSKESTPEMKQRVLALLQELEKENGETYVNPKIQDMELDIETIERMVRGKQIK